MSSNMKRLDLGEDLVPHWKLQINSIASRICKHQTHVAPEAVDRAE